MCEDKKKKTEALLLKKPAGTAVGITGLCNSDLIKSKFRGAGDKERLGLI